jgi:hypothetical protein
MRVRRVQFDAYNRQFQMLDGNSSYEREDVDSYVIPDFSAEDDFLPEDLDIFGDVVYEEE